MTKKTASEPLLSATNRPAEPPTGHSTDVPVHLHDFNAPAVQGIDTPDGIPVATMGVNGAQNAAILACEMLALSDEAVARLLELIESDRH